ncbi:MAG: 50S ribosomal protein L1 [Thermoanaerobaculia bacterium]
MGYRSKRYRSSAEKKRPEPVPVSEAVATLKKFDNAKFDETVELSMKLGIDPKQSNQSVRGSFSLPHGIGKTVKVVVFAEGEAAQKAKQAGALEVGGEELAKKILDGWLDFDVAIAHPGMMRHVGKLGRVLGPHGKMPSPKSGTVTDDIERVVREFVAGKIEFRNDDTGNLHVVMGRKSFPAEKLTANVSAFLEHVKSLKPSSSKGIFLQKVCLSSTMSPGIPVAVS